MRGRDELGRSTADRSPAPVLDGSSLPSLPSAQSWFAPGRTSDKRTTAVASAIPSTELLSPMTAPNLNHASNARKNQHKREIATALHVLVGAPFCERDSVVPSDGVFTSEHALREPQKGATLSHFFSGARRLFGRRSCSTSHSAVMTSDREGPFSARQKASWRTCTGKRPAISAGVHYLPVSLSCAAQRVRPGRSSRGLSTICDERNPSPSNPRS